MSLISLWRAVGAIIGLLVPLTAFFSFTVRNSGTITGIGSLIILLIHAILAITALPFVIIGFKSSPHHLLFERIIFLEASISVVILFFFVTASPELRSAVTPALIGNGVFVFVVYKTHREHKKKLEFERNFIQEWQSDS